MIFKPYKGFFIFCMFFICLFYSLGIWQLHRYHYKKTLLAAYQHSLHTAPMPILQLSDYPRFQPVIAQGKYLNHLTLFLQNRYYKDQLGIEILTPFKIAGASKLILIDRGWIKTQNNQTVAVEKVLGTQKIVGYIKWLDESPFILGNNILKQTSTQIVLQKIDIEALSKMLHQTFYPFILRLDPAQSHGFVRDWVIATVLPQRHMAYAIQWFVMAIVLLIAYLISILSRSE